MTRALLNYYSAGNFGDDLFVYLLATTFPNTHFSVVLNRPSGALQQLPNLTVHRDRIAKTVDRLFYRHQRTRRSWSREKARATNCDLTILVGGSLFIESNPHEDASRFAHLLSLPRPFLILGANVGPVRTEQYLTGVRSVLQHADHVVLRDAASESLAGPADNIEVASDLLFALPLPSSVTQPGSVAVSIIQPDRKGHSIEVSDGYYRALAVFVDSLLSQGREVELLAFCPYEGDTVAAREIIKRMSSPLKKQVRIHSYRGDIFSMLTSVTRAEYVVATRFHAAILGYAAGKSVLPISYSDKLDNLLADMGATGPVVQLAELSDSSGTLSLTDSSSFNVSEQRRISQAALARVGSTYAL